jgi:hypothetical protein
MSERDLIDRIEQLERRLRELETREVGGMVPFDRLRTPSWITIVNDFTANNPPPGWQWAGAPFITPPETVLREGTIYAARGYTSPSRSFLYTTTVPTSTWPAIRPYTAAMSVNACGIRVDDGSDNNYVETVLTIPNATRIPEVRLRWRVSGGTIEDVLCSNMSGWWLMGWGVALMLELEGSLWSSWRGRPRVVTPYGRVFDLISPPPYWTWTPTRIGVVVQSGPSSWEEFGVDWTTF